MANTYHGKSGSHNHTASGSAISSGEVFVSSGTCFVSASSIAVGEKGALLSTGQFKVAKVTGTAFSLGEDLYWDVEDSQINDDTANPWAGKCAEAAGSSDTEIILDLNLGTNNG